MSDKSELITRLRNNKKSRDGYIRAKANVNIPSQIRALRLRRRMTQKGLAREAEMKQPRISAMERPGATQFNLETLIRLASAFKVGLVVRFASFSEMLSWENDFRQDSFDVISLDDDADFQREEQLPAVEAAPKFDDRLPEFGRANLSSSKALTEVPNITRHFSLGSIRKELLAKEPGQSQLNIMPPFFRTQTGGGHGTLGSHSG